MVQGAVLGVGWVQCWDCGELEWGLDWTGLDWTEPGCGKINNYTVVSGGFDSRFFLNIDRSKCLSGNGRGPSSSSTS